MHYKIIAWCLLLSSIAHGAPIPPVSTMSLDEKIGQLLMVATVADINNPITQDVLFRRNINNIPSIKQGTELDKLIKEHHIGGVIFLGKSTAVKHYELTQHLKELNAQSNRIPLLFALDAEWGPAMRIEDAVKFPFNLTLGAIRNKGMIKEMGFMIGTMLQALDIGINFGPVADCNTNPENPVINRRSFGENPEMVAQCVQQYIYGLQDAGVAACAKHFPGHGDTNTDSHTGLPCINHSRERLDSYELIPFRAAIQADVKAIMSGHILLPELDAIMPATLSPVIMQTILRNDLAYTGIACTDAMDMEAITKQYNSGDSVLMALQAGNDIIVAPIDIPAAINAIKDAIKSGTITMHDIDKHVTRILNLKRWIANQFPPIKPPLTILRHKKAEDLSKKLYQEAITLVKNNYVLPISIHEPISVVLIGTKEIQPFAYSIKKTNNCTIHLLPSNNTLQELDSLTEPIIIGVYGLSYGKKPYGLTPESQRCITDICKQYKKVAIVLFGNPYALALFSEAPALVAAYEDHPYAQEAAAQVILGIKQPTGILPINPFARLD